MARVGSAGGPRTNQGVTLQQGLKKANGAEIDTLDSTTSGNVYTLGNEQDHVTIGSYEHTMESTMVGGRASVLDAQTTLAGDRVTLSGTGPSAEGQLGYVAGENGNYSAGVGAAIGLGGVAANGRIGDDRNSLGGTIGLGLGAGFELEGSRVKNDDGSVTRSFNVEAKLLGRFAIQGSWTTEPSAGPRGRNLRSRQLAERRLAQQALSQGQ